MGLECTEDKHRSVRFQAFLTASVNLREFTPGFRQTERRLSVLQIPSPRFTHRPGDSGFLMPLLSRWNNRRGDQTAAFWHLSCFTSPRRSRANPLDRPLTPLLEAHPPLEPPGRRPVRSERASDVWTRLLTHHVLQDTRRGVRGVVLAKNAAQRRSRNLCCDRG